MKKSRGTSKKGFSTCAAEPARGGKVSKTLVTYEQNGHPGSKLKPVAFSRVVAALFVVAWLAPTLFSSPGLAAHSALPTTSVLGAYYLNPNTGRFWTMDTYAGSQSDPLSLHKYLYCHADPANRIDPSGHFSTIEVQAATTTAITIDVTAIAAVFYLAHRADIALTESSGKRAILDFVVSHQEGFTQEDFADLERSVASRTSAGRKREIFLHYNRQRYAGSLLTTGLRSPAWATKDVYETGWKAKYYLAAYTGEPRDAVYIVWPKSNVLYYGPNPVRGRLDQWSNIWLAGGGSEYYFPNGSGGALTVFGPIPIPVGEPPPF